MQKKLVVIMVLLSVVLLASGFVIGWMVKSRPGVQSVLKAEKFEVVDKSGTTRAVLTTIEGGSPSLTLIDQSGKYRAWLFLSSDGRPNLVLTDRARFALMDEGERVRSLQRLDDSGSAIVEFYSDVGEIIWSAP